MSKKRITALFSIALLLLLPSLALGATAPAKVSTFAGSGEWGNQDGGRDEARFRLPTYATVNQQGKVYIADTENHLIRQIDQGGKVTTLAGKIIDYDEYGKPVGGNEDGAFLSARFNEPRGLALDGKGNLYVADSLNGSIRKLGIDGQVSTLISGLDFPSDLVLTDEGELYVTETLKHRILKISSEGKVTATVGEGYSSKDGTLVGGYKDGDSTVAQFNEPSGLALAKDGTLYIVDTGNQRVRALSPKGKVRTLAGSGSTVIAETGYIEGGFQDGEGSVAQFNYPHGIVLATDGSLYIADTFNHRVRQVTSDGEVSTIVGLDRHGRENGIEMKAELNHPTDVLVLPNSNLLIVDQWNQRLQMVEWYELPAGVKLDGSINLVWNSQVIRLDTPAEKFSNRVMVPIRPLAEAFGFNVEWSKETGTVIFTQGEQRISLQIGNREVNGDKKLLMDVAPYMKDNRVLVPIRFVAKAFEKQVDWLEPSKTVLIRE